MTEENVNPVEEAPEAPVEETPADEPTFTGAGPVDDAQTSEFVGHATGDDADNRQGWGCRECARFEFDTGRRTGNVEKLSCSACGGKVTYGGYSLWKSSRTDLFPNG